MVCTFCYHSFISVILFHITKIIIQHMYLKKIFFKCFERKHGVNMKKSLIQKDLLCDGNILLFDLYEKMHIVERKEIVIFDDPITEKWLCTRVQARVPRWFLSIFGWTMRHSVDPEGQDRINLLIARGMINDIKERDSSKLWGWRIVFFLSILISKAGN